MHEGILLGILTSGGIWLLWRRAPEILKKIALKARFLADLAATIGAYLIISSVTSSLAGAIGCAIVGICASLGLGVAGAKDDRAEDNASHTRD